MVFGDQLKYVREHLRGDLVVVDGPETVEAKSLLVAKW